MNARTLAPLALLLAAGCELDNFASVQLFQICFPPAPDSSGNCIYPATCDNSLLGRAIVDVSLAINMELPIQINNQLANNAETSTGRLNTNDAHIEKYTMTYSVPGVAVPGTSSFTNDTVPAGGNTVALVEILPSATVTQLSAVASGTATTIVAKVVASGRYDNGNSFTTGPYQVALDVCSGCLGFPATNACSGTKTFSSACPRGAVLGGLVVSTPVNALCE